MTRIDYAAVNGRGVTLRTFDSRQLAHEWVNDHADAHHGLCVEIVTTKVMRRRIDACGRFVARSSEATRP